MKIEAKRENRRARKKKKLLKLEFKEALTKMREEEAEDVEKVRERRFYNSIDHDKYRLYFANDQPIDIIQDFKPTRDQQVVENRFQERNGLVEKEEKPKVFVKK